MKLQTLQDSWLQEDNTVRLQYDLAADKLVFSNTSVASFLRLVL